jgi:ribosomal protein S18 acetylase RimI-like enzyme
MELKPAYTLTLEQLAALFNEAFAGYIGGNISFTAETLSRFMAWDSVNLAWSQVFMQDDQPVGFGYVSRQGWTSRLAAFGVIPSASGAGIGKAAMRGMIEQARERGDREYLLEVIEQNTRAVRLYQRVGFEIMRRLVGYAAETLRGDSDPAGLRQINVYDAAKVIIQHGIPDLPWQIAGTTLARHTPPDVAYHLQPGWRFNRAACHHRAAGAAPSGAGIAPALSLKRRASGEKVGSLRHLPGRNRRGTYGKIRLRPAGNLAVANAPNPVTSYFHVAH